MSVHNISRQINCQELAAKIAQYDHTAFNTNHLLKGQQ